MLRSTSEVKSRYQVKLLGEKDSTDYRVYLSNDNIIMSFFHDVPIKKDEKTYNMICEIPRWSNAKLEISTKKPMNPIVQDLKDGKLRYIKNLFPYTGYIWNYGAIPQTWEDPNIISEHTNLGGDGDPIDAIEIGHKKGYVGEVMEVKVLCILGLIDGDETDWKVIVIRKDDPIADKLNDIDDIKKEMPGLLESTREWFRNYKIPDGKGENKFAFNGEYKGREFAEKIIEETHYYWKKLVDSHDTTNKKISIASAMRGDVSEVEIGELKPFKIEKTVSDDFGYFFKK